VNVPAGHAPPTQREKIATEHSKWLMYADYDPVALRLEVGFKSGKIVQHWPVYPQTWIDFKLAPSKGSFYNAAIKKLVAPIEIKA
jgi:hypothetical protein